MCERCVASGKMSQEEADAQAAEFAEILGMVGAAEGGGFQMPPMPAFVTRLMIQQMAEEFVSGLTQFGYAVSVGTIDNGNLVVGLVAKDDASGGAPGYVLGEFSADDVRKMLGEGA